jgi:hypothetical protein
MVAARYLISIQIQWSQCFQMFNHLLLWSQSPISFGFHAALYESEHSIVQLDVCSACRRKWERAAFGRTCAIQPWNDRFSDFKLVEFEPEARCPPVALTRSQLSPVHVELAVPLSESKPSRGFRGRQAKMQQHSHSLPEYVVQGHVVCDGCGLVRSTLVNKDEMVTLSLVYHFYRILWRTVFI